MTALERTLDTLFGDMDDLLSEHQKPEGYTYEGDRIYEPAPFTDRGRVMLDLLHKFQLMYPGIIITDTEFITSGYAAFKFPNIGPYHDVEVYINRHVDVEHRYELQVQWGGYSQSAGIFSVRDRMTAGDFDSQFATILGRLFIRTFNGLTIYNNQERFQGIFQEYTCKDITEKQVATFRNLYEAIYGMEQSFRSIGVDWARVAQQMQVYQVPTHSTSIDNENIKYRKQNFYEVNDKVVLKENGKRVRGIVKSISTEPRKANKYFIKTERGTLYQLPSKYRSNAKVALLGKEVSE